MIRTFIVTLLLIVPTTHAQLFSFDQGSGVPTQTLVGGLLGAAIAPMISKGSDANSRGGFCREKSAFGSFRAGFVACDKSVASQ